ncbi:hypothetical protein CUZ91_1031 [Enterococcus xinjiangensis]|nr:hypothetical protein [Enterococcus lactis]MBL4999976.1 hypothetical protein [Enterococcus lactis]
MSAKGLKKTFLLYFTKIIPEVKLRIRFLKEKPFFLKNFLTFFLF